MPSVKILHDFLLGEDEWAQARLFERSSFFRRVRETVSVWDWADQNINRSAKPPQTAGWPERLVRLFNRAK